MHSQGPVANTQAHTPRMYMHTYTVQLAISTASFTAKRTAQMETGLMVVRDLHAPFILRVNVTRLLRV